MHNAILKYERENIDVPRKCVGFPGSVLSKNMVLL